MPVWVLKLLLSFAIRCLTKKLGSLEVTQHAEAALAKYTPLAPEENSAPWKANDPNNNPPERGGRPR